MPKEMKWERNVASIVTDAVRLGLMEPAVELMWNHSLMGSSILKKLKISKVLSSARSRLHICARATTISITSATHDSLTYIISINLFAQQEASVQDESNFDSKLVSTGLIVTSLAH